MKRLFVLLLAFVTVFSFQSCSDDDEAVIQVTYINQLLLKRVTVQMGSDTWYATYIEPTTGSQSQAIYWQTEFPAVESDGTEPVTATLTVVVEDANLTAIDSSAVTDFTIGDDASLLSQYKFTVSYTPKKSGIAEQTLYVTVTDDDGTGLYRKVPLKISQVAFGAN